MKLLSRFYLALLAVFLALPAAIASAQEIDGDDTLAEVRLSATSVTLIVSLFIPIVVGIITRSSTSGWVKGLLTLIVNGINAAIVAAVTVDGSAVWNEETLLIAVIGFVTSVAMYVGVWKPANVTSNEGGKLASVGVK